MTAEQIQSIVSKGRFPGPKSPATLVETHISWVILTPDYAFKIKKPVQFPFLDFSTLEKRAFYCQEELRLNRRLAANMYLDVLPIQIAEDGLPEIVARDAAVGAPMDYAVFMHRMDNAWQMDKLLLRNVVKQQDMRSLASILVHFHKSAVLSGGEAAYVAGENRADFDALFDMSQMAERVFGPDVHKTFDHWRALVGTFLDRHEPRLHQRAETGFWVNGHGDLHARNIFLLPAGPIVFDCIEFNPHFRRLDVLSELAFLCMDLDAGGHHELSDVFMQAYCLEWPCMACPEDERLFQYFKAYRASVRLKVTLMELEQHVSPDLEASAKRYRDLVNQYVRLILH